MKKRLVLLVLALALTLSLTACMCSHETWLAATCTTPKTCADCGIKEGGPLGHTWKSAICTTPKTCETCSQTEGIALGHSWQDATCEAPKTCATCKLTEGSALGHDWQEATTEAPKTCATCKRTEGKKIETDPRFTTASTKAIQGTWAYDYSFSGKDMELHDFTGALKMQLVMELHNDGVIKLSMLILNEKDFRNDLLDYMVEATYAELRKQGFSQSQADSAFQSAYGMTIEAYMSKEVDKLMRELPEKESQEGVYYVSNGKLYAADSWNDTMDPIGFTLSGDTLTLDSDISGNGGDALTFKRVS